jgi:hypothetical protein
MVMSNDEFSQEVSRLRAARADAHTRGFATLTCLPNKKDPYPKYSPHACHSATQNFATAMLPYDAGEAANFGIGCGESDLCVIDGDHGCNTYEEFIAWRDRNHFPPTLTARTGNRDGYRFHMFYRGAVKTVAFNIDGVTGEIKSAGGYVCGVGSRHPSGFLYEYILDVPLASTPEFVRTLAKVKTKPATMKDEDFELVEEGQRNGRLTSLAGSLRNLGLTEAGILSGIEDFARNRCENGDAYADLNEIPLRNMAYRASHWDIAAQGEVVFLKPVTTGLGMRKILAANALRDSRGEKL